MYVIRYHHSGQLQKWVKINIDSGVVENITQGAIMESPSGKKRSISNNFKTVVVDRGLSFIS